MGRAFKTGGTVTIYFGDSIRKLLRKPLRKKNTYFADYMIASIDGDVLTVFPNSKAKDKDLPHEVAGLCINKSDKHILGEGELDSLRNLSKSEINAFAAEHDYNIKEFKEALKPFRKGSKQDDQ